MQFKVGDSVVHPVHGVGHIARLEEKRFFGEEARLYYEVTTPKSTVWVPVEAHDAIGMRLLTDKSDLAQYRSLLRSHPAPLDRDPHKRRIALADRLRRGSLKVVCEIVRDLTARGWRRPLNEADAVILRKARDILCQEWAAVVGVPLAEATGEIDSLLQAARQAYRV